MKDGDHLYADSAQAREADQRRSRQLDQWGNPVQLASDFCHDYDSTAMNAAEADRLERFKPRLQRALQEMEAFLNGRKA